MGRVKNVGYLVIHSEEEYDQDGVGMECEECEEDDTGMGRVKRMGWGLTEGRVSIAEYGILKLPTSRLTDSMTSRNTSFLR